MIVQQKSDRGKYDSLTRVIGEATRHLPLTVVAGGILDDFEILCSHRSVPIGSVSNGAAIASDLAEGDGEDEGWSETVNTLHAEAKGVAQLFIASPDLYEALEALVKSLDGAMFAFIDRQERVEKAAAIGRKALAKARGEAAK
jgi:hypothetical protein